MPGTFNNHAHFNPSKSFGQSVWVFIRIGLQFGSALEQVFDSVMLSRFQLFRKSVLPVAGVPDGKKKVHGRRYIRGWVILAGLTAVFLAWLAYRLLMRPAWPDLVPLVGELIDLGEAASAFTLTFLWVGLWWRRHNPAHRPVTVQQYGVEKLYELSPADFEKYVAALFQRKGYKVGHRGGSGDHGVDLELIGPDGRRAIVQCKRYQHTVGPDIVRELYGTLIHERAMRGFLVTTADISEAAEEWARGKPITLIDGPTLVAIAGSLGGD
jgi:restriction system protein